MKHNDRLGSSVNMLQAALANQVEAVYRLPHPCGNSDSADICALLTADVSLHALKPAVSNAHINQFQFVWPDAWPLMQQASIALRQQLGEKSAEVDAWQRGILARRLMEASVLIATGKPSTDAASAAAEQLCLAACALGLENIPQTAQYAAAVAQLDTQLSPHPTVAPSDAPSCLPALVAVYEEIDTAILVVEDVNALTDVDWSAVQTHFRKFPNLMITTLRQFHLLAYSELAVAFGIGRYRLHWGVDLTSELIVPLRIYLLNATQAILEIYTRSLPQGVIRANESDFGKLIHDIQNQLLKVQFQYELLNMVFDISERSAPRLHADRTLPLKKRIDSLVPHLQQWVALYTALLNANP